MKGLAARVGELTAPGRSFVTLRNLRAQTRLSTRCSAPWCGACGARFFAKRPELHAWARRYFEERKEDDDDSDGSR